jgi:hypothetical protein
MKLKLNFRTAAVLTATIAWGVWAFKLKLTAAAGKPAAAAFP